MEVCITCKNPSLFFRKHIARIESIFIILSIEPLCGPEGAHEAVGAACTLQKVPWHSGQLLTGNTTKLKSEEEFANPFFEALDDI